MMQNEDFLITPLGDSAIIIDFGNRVDTATNQRVTGIAAALRKAQIFGVKDVVPAYSSIAVFYDPIVLWQLDPHKTALENIKQRIAGLLYSDTNADPETPLRTRIPVCYAPVFGPDLGEVACYANASIADVIRLHTAKVYRTYMIGFLPGFAYMGDVDQQIAMPRKAQPRLQIPAGSVGIAGRQTGIYPLTSPGGWQIIGRTPVELFNKDKPEPVLLHAGDEVVFFSITEDEFNSY